MASTHMLLYFLLFCYTAHSQFLQPASSFMPSRPVLSPRLCFRRHERHGRIIKFISDQQTKCMYWECTAGRPIPRQCGLQTFISEFFEGDEYNPCTEMYTDTSLQFDCTRKGFDPEGNPVCMKLYEDNNTCKNGGKVTSQGSLCWCECAGGFTGFQCTIPPKGTASATQPPEIIVESAEELFAPQPASNTLDSIAENPRQGVLVNDDSTGPILPANPERPSPQTVILNEGLDTAGPIEFAEDDVTGVAPPAEILGETSGDPSADFLPAPVEPQSQVVVPQSQIDAPQNQVDAPQNQVDVPQNQVDAPQNQVDVPASVTQATAGRFISGDPCPQGRPQEDYCLRQGGCLNGGTCVNQCLGASCLCRPPYTAGRRCEQYRCTVNVECMNGGTCRRGASGINPVATCTCLAGFTGAMCELPM